jgi:hypothetical protein
MAEHANEYLTPRPGVSQGAGARSVKKYGADSKPAPGSVAQPFVACHEESYQPSAVSFVLHAPPLHFDNGSQKKAALPIGSAALTTS